MRRTPAMVLLGALLGATPAAASDGLAHEETKLAKLTQNPGSPLVSIPFQYDFNGGLPSARTQLQLNLQPVLPVRLSDHTSFITRWIVPVLGQPDDAPSGTTWGVGDITSQLFLATGLSDGLTLGVGGALLLPTATDARLGLGKLAVGPLLLAVYTKDALVAGALVTFVASVAGDDTRSPVRLLTAQPFVNVNLPKGTYLVTSPLMTFELEGDQSTVPLGAGFGKVFMFGDTPTNVSVQAFWNAAHPDGGADWQLRITLQLLFPQPAPTDGEPDH